MIPPFSRLTAASTRHIKMNLSQLARWRTMAGAVRDELDYLRGSGAGVRPICLKSAISLATTHRRDESHRANVGILVADAIVQWMINGEGIEEDPKCN